MSKSKTIEKTIEVTIIITDCDGKKETMLGFLEPESGDFVRILPTDDFEDTVHRVGNEICSWLPLMDEELDDMDYEEEDKVW